MIKVNTAGMVVVGRRNVPIAEICPLPRRPRERHRIGIDRGMRIPPGFFDALPDDLLDAFEGAAAAE